MEIIGEIALFLSDSALIHCLLHFHCLRYSTGHSFAHIFNIYIGARQLEI